MRILENASENLRQRLPGICILEELLPRLIVPLPYVRDERWLVPNKKEYQAAKDSRGVIYTRISSLAEEERDNRSVRDRLCQLVDDSAEQHRLALAGVALNP